MRSLRNLSRFVELLVFILNTIIYFLAVWYLEGGFPTPNSILVQYLFFYAAMVLSLYAFRGYGYIFGRDPEDILVSSSVGVILGALVTVAFVMIFQKHIPKVSFLVLCGIFLVWTPLSRIIVAKLFRKYFPPKEVVVIGKPDKWKNLMEEISERLGGKIKILNWMDSEVEPEEIEKLCTCSVVIAEPNLITKKETQHALDNLQAKNKDVTYLPKIAEDILRRVPLQIASEFKEYYEMVFEMVSLDPKQRAFDVALSLITLPITLTLGIIISIMIFIDSGMPIIFSQRRIGLNGKPFTLHKFRSMSNAPKKEMGFADDHASYITRVGKVLRKFRIDEIPQIWDVLRGEMSIIGPRPEQPEFEAQFAENIPFYKYRRKLKPGITGWAQVNFSYAADLEETAKKLEYDLYYVKNRNIMLDLQITLRTAEIMLLMRGAK